MVGGGTSASNGWGELQGAGDESATTSATHAMRSMGWSPGLWNKHPSSCMSSSLRPFSWPLK